MIGDPNWFYSTIAQSSAAIVAIVGGFITHRILTLITEKRGLKNQLADKQARLDALIQKYGDLTKIKSVSKEGEKIQTLTKPADPKAQEILQLTEEINNLETLIRTFAYPPHLQWGLVILACFAFGSIVLPIMVMVIGIYPVQAKQFIFILFVLGLAALFGYIAFHFKELRR